ncbi:hypothetical protein NXY00_20205 [Bacteroides sp. BFG-551]|nr:hypothetical protein [Bacteroides sp. BFG-551]
MIDERAYELFCCQLGLANEEKAGLRKRVNELIVTVECYRKKSELMRKQLEAKDEVNRLLANEISNLRLQLEESRKHRFGCASGQRRLLNNRLRRVNRQEEKRLCPVPKRLN